MSHTTNTLEAAGFSPLDEMTWALKSVDHAHHELHEGNLYRVVMATSRDDGARLTFSMQTPDSDVRVHLEGVVFGKYDTEVKFYESTLYTSGNAVTAYNANRNSSNTTTLTLKEAATGATAGTMIEHHRFGDDTTPSGKEGFGGEARTEVEWLLAANTKYLLEITSHTNANVINANMNWYEEVPKDS